MENLEDKILKAANGESRLNPDEQRQYFGTFAERVILAISLENSQLDSVKSAFRPILDDFKRDYPTLFVKISPKLPVPIQMFYMKTAQQLDIQSTIVNEVSADSPYGIIIHSDKAENIQNFLLSERFPNILTKHTEQIPQKKSFWSKLLGH